MRPPALPMAASRADHKAFRRITCGSHPHRYPRLHALCRPPRWVSLTRSPSRSARSARSCCTWRTRRRTSPRAARGSRRGLRAHTGSSGTSDRASRARYMLASSQSTALSSHTSLSAMSVPSLSAPLPLAHLVAAPAPAHGGHARARPHPDAHGRVPEAGAHATCDRPPARRGRARRRGRAAPAAAQGAQPCVRAGSDPRPDGDHA
jgi:hypothetical protein